MAAGTHARSVEAARSPAIAPAPKSTQKPVAPRTRGTT